MNKSKKVIGHKIKKAKASNKKSKKASNKFTIDDLKIHEQLRKDIKKAKSDALTAEEKRKILMDREIWKKQILNECKQFILEIVNEKCKNIRKPKYTNEYYLNHIINVLTTLQSWFGLCQCSQDKTEIMQKKIILILSCGHWKTTYHSQLIQRR